MTPPSTIAHYRITGKLGEGGMGAVYSAVDTRLGRKVAIKVSHERFSARFEREARTISALNHPHICTLYDVGPNYMVTELVEGETLRAWLRHSPSTDRILEAARQVLEALRSAHGAGIIHRDLKPENIMIRSDGYVKVLDFGLARRIPGLPALSTDLTATVDLTLPGQFVGTVAYMPPEQILGQEADPRSDLFAFGVVLYEMLAGAHPWRRASTVDTLHAILHDDPPPIDHAVAPVVEQLLRKHREERYPSAEAVLEALASPPTEAPRSRAPTRLIVLPFRLLRRHEASDFLAVSLPDAITTSLAGIDSLVVRSTMLSSRFAASPEPDLQTIAEQAQVDAVLTGAILSDGERLRVSTQLVRAPDGALLWSNTSDASLQNIFQVQDELVDRIVQSLALPLTAREQRGLKQDVPASAISYELFLRANQLVAVSYEPRNMILARDLYLRSLDLDPHYAPAWAYLGRTYLLIGKYGVEDLAENLARAEEAFRKAFSLNPDLAVAHNFYTSLETDLGRSLNAMERLLSRAQAHRNDPNLLAGLVHTCRYCGLLEASAAAHEQAVRLDPHIRTSVGLTWLELGEFQKALDCGTADPYTKANALVALGRRQEAIEAYLEFEKAAPTRQLRLFSVSKRAHLEGDRQTSLEALDQCLDLAGPVVNDPEGQFWTARLLAELDQTERALDFLARALDSGYRCHYALLHDPSLESLRSHPRFAKLVDRAAALDLEARKIFLDHGGGRLLGIHLDET